MYENFEVLLGKTFTKIETYKNNDVMTFFADDGSVYQFYHEQDCCEQVSIEDIDGDLNDLVGTPLMVAEVVTNKDEPKKDDNYIDDSFTWTFYKFATIKGYVTVRWYGSSNGYYSEEVNFRKVE